MIKSIATYTIVFALVFFSIYFSRDYTFGSLPSLRFKTWDTDKFFALTSLIICVHFKLFSNIKALKPQLGFIYLPTLFIKGVLFFILFKTSVFTPKSLTASEQLHLLIPLLIFIVLEVYYVVKIIRAIKH